ncbi:hypothetical protein [Microcoleus sp. AR_TQ3_B6]|uniref:hypothetical protein n=1 Tax=Microcoleus sp. AR_TQ3_B6 TaxID=3055284 RepID=UPI002FD12C79
MEFSTVEELEQGNSATDSLSGDGRKKEEGRRKKEVRQRIRKGGCNGCNGCQEEARRKKQESFLKLARPNAFRPNY